MQICALHLAAQKGHVDILHLLLSWKADVTFRSADGRNALDFAIDFNQKECVLALIKHETWQLSLKNAVYHRTTGLFRLMNILLHRICRIYPIFKCMVIQRKFDRNQAGRPPYPK